MVGSQFGRTSTQISGSIGQFALPDMPGAFYRQDIQANTISISAAGEQTPFVNVLVAVDMHQTRQLKTDWYSVAERERIIRALRSFSMTITPLY